MPDCDLRPPDERQILLVDDHPLMVRLLAVSLRSLGRLRYAASGPAALERAREVRPDLVLLDAEMPGMTGLEVCARMRADPSLATVLIVFVSAHQSAQFERCALAAGASGFIRKPIDPPSLLVRVRALLAEQREPVPGRACSRSPGMAVREPSVRVPATAPGSPPETARELPRTARQLRTPPRS